VRYRAGVWKITEKKTRQNVGLGEHKNARGEEGRHGGPSRGVSHGLTQKKGLRELWGGGGWGARELA